MTEGIVVSSFALVADDLVCSIDFFKLFFRRFFVLRRSVEIRMVLAGEFAEGLLDVVVGRRPFNAESFVVVALSHGEYFPVYCTTRPGSTSGETRSYEQ